MNRHPLMQAALENDRELEFEVDGIRKGIAALNERIAFVRKHGCSPLEKAAREFREELLRFIASRH